MPAPGAQHRPTAAAANPFETTPTRLTEYTAQEIATLQSRLDKQLGPEYISSRPGAGGGKVHYITAEKVINLANEVFGFNGWSSEIRAVQTDFVDETPGSVKVTLGLSIIMRVTLRDGTFHEDIGYGHIENCKGKAAAFEKAKKEAATDGLKRALRNFGNILGNCLYDKDYLAKVTKVKVAPTKWDADNLHRHPDFVPGKKDNIVTSETPGKQEATPEDRTSDLAVTDYDDEFGADLLDGVELTEGHPDEITIQPLHEAEVKPQPQNHGPQGGPAHRSGQPPTPLHNRNSASGINHPLENANRPQPPDQDLRNQPLPQTNTTPQSHPIPQNMTQQQPINQPQRQHEPPIGFISSRGADMLTKEDQPPPNNNLPVFNPNAESPSIRQTGNISRDRSRPISRQAVAMGPGPSPASENVPHQVPGGRDARDPNSASFVNPSSNAGRRIGMPPPTISSPLTTNRGAYKPPGPALSPLASGAKRTLAQANDTANSPRPRTPLADVSNVDGGISSIAVEDSKRAKLEP